MLEQIDKAELDVQYLAECGEDLRCEDGVPADGEKVVVRTDALDAEDVAPDLCDRALEREIGRASCRERVCSVV